MPTSTSKNQVTTKISIPVCLLEKKNIFPLLEESYLIRVRVWFTKNNSFPKALRILSYFKIYTHNNQYNTTFKLFV